MSYLKSVFSLIVLFLFSLNLSAQLATVDEGCAPMSIQFMAPANATSFSWDFGNGNTATDQNPTSNYINPGTYPISFTDGTNTFTDTVFIYNKPVVNFEADTLIGCEPFEVNFTSTTTIDLGVIITSYDWSFGDLTSGSGADISHTYNRPGTFTVALDLLSSMPSCESFGDEVDYITVNPIPDVIISADETSACSPPLQVNFTNGTANLPNYTYEWDFGNGETLIGRDPSPITYDAVGTYNATLTVTDDLGCSSDSTIVISVGGPNVDIIIGDTICASQISQLIRNGSSNGDYFWDFIPPFGTRSFSTLRQPNVRFPDEGTYTIILTVTDPDGGCTSSDTIMVYAEIPSTDFTVDPSYTCDYPVDLVYTPLGTDILNVSWIIFDASLDSTYATSDSIATYGILRDTSTYGLNGLREIETTLRFTNARGCVAFETKKDTFFAPNARFNTDTIMGCLPLEVTFYDSMSVSNEAITSYVYEWGDGTPNSTFTTNDSVKHTFMQAGEYDVVLYISNAANPSCIDTSYAVTIFVGDQVTADFTVDQASICPGDSIQFTGIGDTTLIDDWHFDTDGSRLSHCADDRNPIWGFESITGTMDATLTVIYNGCATKVEKPDLITVNGPIAQLDYLNDCDNKFQVVFADSSHEAIAISWDFGDMSTPSTMSNPSHIYADTGDYQVILTASNPRTGCPDSRDTTMVHIRDLEANFELEDNYCQGEMIMFDASMSTDVNATCWKGYTWFPSDSRPITTEDVMIDYAWTGIDTQTLELIVQDINGCQDTLRDTTIVWQVIAEGEADPLRLCAPNNVQFTDLSTANGRIDRWEWDFGDMIGTSDVQNPLYTYTTTPTAINTDTIYTVTLIAFDTLNCSDTLPIIIDFYEPISVIDVDTTVCIGDEITYSATDFTNEGSFLTYEWFLNDVSIGTNQSGTVTMDMVGNQTLRVDFIEDATGCMNSTEAIINVQAFPDSSFTSTIDGNAINCAGQNVTFTASDNSPGLSYGWDVGDGNGISFSDMQTVETSVRDASTITVQLVVETTNGCFTTSSQDYTFVKPEGDLTTTTTTICQGDELIFQIDTSNVSSFVITGGGIDETTAPVNHIFNDVGIFGVDLITTLIIDGGRQCTDTSTLVIDVLQGGLAVSPSDTSICERESVRLFVVNPDPSLSYTWSPGGERTTSITVSPREDTRYEVEIDGTSGACSEKASIEVTVFPSPEVDGDTIFTMVKTPEEGKTLPDFSLTALSSELAGLNITWSPDDENLDVSNELQPVVSNFQGEPIEYTATVVSGLARCYSETFSRILTPALIPNIFSPNDDMVNDFFQVFIDENDAEINVEDIVTFQVFNRWGQMVYNNETPDTGWNGRYNDEEQISDVFVYKIVFRMPDGSLSDPCEGDVTLYR